MGTGLEEYKVIERVRESYLKNRGNIIRVLEETNLPEDYVRKIVAKLRKSDDWKVSQLVAENITKHLLTGRDSRITHLMELIKKFEQQEKKTVSTCCEDTVRTVTQAGSNEVLYECLRCGHLTDTVDLINPDTYKAKLIALDELRKEDEFLIKFCEKMGYTEQQLPVTVIKNQQNILVMPGAKGQISEEHMKQIEALKPIEQEALRLKLEKEIREAEIVDDEDDAVNTK